MQDSRKRRKVTLGHSSALPDSLGTDATSIIVTRALPPVDFASVLVCPSAIFCPNFIWCRFSSTNSRISIQSIHLPHDRSLFLLDPRTCICPEKLESRCCAHPAYTAFHLSRTASSLSRVAGLAGEDKDWPFAQPGVNGETLMRSWSDGPLVRLMSAAKGQLDL
ncbi:hypothetical protein PM082_001823 [Marasmius tenuissimus]|nr:hypothetical protein PM082_001823 [Marasmius tenuissimus]